MRYCVMYTPYVRPLCRISIHFAEPRVKIIGREVYLRQKLLTDQIFVSCQNFTHTGISTVLCALSMQDSWSVHKEDSRLHSSMLLPAKVQVGYLPSPPTQPIDTEIGVRWGVWWGTWSSRIKRHLYTSRGSLCASTLKIRLVHSQRTSPLQ